MCGLRGGGGGRFGPRFSEIAWRSRGDRVEWPHTPRENDREKESMGTGRNRRNGRSSLSAASDCSHARPVGRCGGYGIWGWGRARLLPFLEVAGRKSTRAASAALIAAQLSSAQLSSAQLSARARAAASPRAQARRPPTPRRPRWRWRSPCGRARSRQSARGEGAAAATTRRASCCRLRRWARRDSRGRRPPIGGAPRRGYACRVCHVCSVCHVCDVCNGAPRLGYACHVCNVCNGMPRLGYVQGWGPQ